MLQHLKKLLWTQAPAASTPSQRILINAYCTNADVPDLPVPHHLNARRSLSDPALAGHLDGFMGYVRSRGDGAMTATRYHVLRHIERTQQHLSFEIDEGALDDVAHWAEGANAMLFLPDGHVRDARGRILVSAQDGAADPAAVVPYPADAWARQARTTASLATQGYAVPADLPPVIAASEVQLRAPRAVAARALALMLVALKAECAATGASLTPAEIARELPLSSAYLTPAERTFVDTEQPAQNASRQFSWRYESMFLLEWALGWIDTLPFPNAMCDVTLAARIILHGDQAALLRNAALRPVNEILDALDLHYRLHWLVRQAQADGAPAPDGVAASVVLERHHALNWLVRFEGSDWDEVDTPT